MPTLVAYQVAIELVRELRPIVVELQKHDSNLADQLRRAATSVVTNLSEGQRRTRGGKHHAFEIAHGEAREVLGCLECAEAWGYIASCNAARAKVDRLLGLLWGLTHPKRAA